MCAAAEVLSAITVAYREQFVIGHQFLKQNQSQEWMKWNRNEICRPSGSMGLQRWQGLLIKSCFWVIQGGGQHWRDRESLE